MRRIGRFSINCALIDEDQSLCKRILNNTIVVEADIDYHSDSVNYIALSDSFSLVDSNQAIPSYIVIVECIKTNNGEPRESIRFELKQ